MTERSGTDDQRTNLDSQNNNDHVAEIQETTPLLNSSEQRNNCCDKVMLIFLGLMLIIGFSIGAYLLDVEGENDVPENIIIVPKSDWTTYSNNINISQLVLPSTRILITQTNSEGCTREFECLKELRNLQKQQMENFHEPAIMYNFIVGGDGRLYEGRGWKYQSAFQDDNEQILTVAFLGNYEDVPPSNQQYKVLKTFVDFAIMKNYLVPCFDILVRDSVSNYLLDLAYAVEEREKLENGC